LGRSLAVRAARAGFRVFLEDVLPTNLQRARESIGRELASQLQPGIVFVSSIEDAVREADLVVDCVPDELESKLEILWLVDRMAPPRTVIATPTLNLSIADLASCTNRPEKCVAVAATIAELSSGAEPKITLRAAPPASEATVSQVRDFWQELGFQPTVEQSTESPPY